MIEKVCLLRTWKRLNLAKRPFKDQPAQPPGTAEAGAAIIRAHAVRLYDRQDGEGTDWRMVTDALFRAAFAALDRLPDDTCRSVARRVHSGSYERVTDGPKADPAASQTGVASPKRELGNTMDLKSDNLEHR